MGVSLVLRRLVVLWYLSITSTDILRHQPVRRQSSHSPLQKKRRRIVLDSDSDSEPVAPSHHSKPRESVTPSFTPPSESQLTERDEKRHKSFLARVNAVESSYASVQTTQDPYSSRYPWLRPDVCASTFVCSWIDRDF